RLAHHVGIYDEIFSQERKRHRPPSGAKVLQRAAEPALLGQHADAASPRFGVAAGQLAPLGPLAQHPRRRRGPLDFADEWKAGLRIGERAPKPSGGLESAHLGLEAGAIFSSGFAIGERRGDQLAEHAGWRPPAHCASRFSLLSAISSRSLANARPLSRISFATRAPSF